MTEFILNMIIYYKKISTSQDLHYNKKTVDCKRNLKTRLPKKYNFFLKVNNHGIVKRIPKQLI